MKIFRLELYYCWLDIITTIRYMFRTLHKHICFTFFKAEHNNTIVLFITSLEGEKMD